MTHWRQVLKVDGTGRTEILAGSILAQHSMIDAARECGTVKEHLRRAEDVNVGLDVLSSDTQTTQAERSVERRTRSRSESVARYDDDEMHRLQVLELLRRSEERMA